MARARPKALSLLPTGGRDLSRGYQRRAMPPPSVETVERRLLALDPSEFRSFVAAAYRESGWTVDVEGAVLVASRDGETRRLLVVPPRRIAPGVRATPEHEGPIDVVVSPYREQSGRSLPRAVPDAPVEGADSLRDRVCYALDAETRDRLLREHLGIDPANPDAAVGIRPLPPLRRPGSGRAAAGAVGVALVFAGLFVLLAASGAFGPDGGAGTVNASEPTSAGTSVVASASGYDAEPTCQRGPRQIAEISVAALRGPDPNRGLVTMGRFWNDQALEGSPSGGWSQAMRSPSRLSFYNASAVTIGDAEFDGDDATVLVQASIEGEQRPYVFRFTRIDTNVGDGCWAIEFFGQVVDTA